MKNLSFILLLASGAATMVHLSAQEIDTYQPPQKQTKCSNCDDEKETSIILGTFACIASSLFNIVQEPHNIENVRQNVATIIQVFGGAIAAATKGGHEFLDDINSEEFAREIEKIILTKAKKFRLHDDLDL